MSGLAFPLLVLFLTHSPFQAGLVGFVRGIPYAVLSLPAGALVDRWDRKRVMVLCDLGRAGAFLSLALALLTGHVLLFHLYAVALVEGILYVLFDVAEVAAISTVVPAPQLPSAVGLNQAILPMTGLVGAPLGGLLLQAGRAVPFAADAASYLLSALALSTIRAPFRRSEGPVSGSLRSGLGEGLRWLWRERLFRTLALISAGNNFWDEGMGLIVIVLARGQGASPAVIGIVFAVGAVGGIAGSFLAGAVRSRFPYGRAIVATRWVLLVFWLTLLADPNALILGLVLAVLEAAEMTYGVLQVSRRITLIPEHLQGRANSAFRLLSYGAEPLGAAAAGVLLSAAGLHITVGAFAVLLAALALAASLDRVVRQA
jgi:MFS family permease